LGNDVAAWILGFLYGIVPFLLCVFLFYTLFTIRDTRERGRMAKESKGMKKRLGRRFWLLVKGAAIAFTIAIIIILIVAVMP
jgi:hypothetical protein